MLTWTNVLKTIAVFGELVGSVSVKKIASGFIFFNERKINILLIDQIVSPAFVLHQLLTPITIKLGHVKCHINARLILGIRFSASVTDWDNIAAKLLDSNQ